MDCVSHRLWQAQPSKAIMLVLDYWVFVWALLEGSYLSGGIFYKKKNPKTLVIVRSDLVR